MGILILYSWRWAEKSMYQAPTALLFLCLMGKESRNGPDGRCDNTDNCNDDRTIQASFLRRGFCGYRNCNHDRGCWCCYRSYGTDAQGLQGSESIFRLSSGNVDRRVVIVVSTQCQA